MIKSHCIISCKNAILHNSHLKDHSASCVTDNFAIVHIMFFNDYHTSCTCHIIVQGFFMLISRLIHQKMQNDLRVEQSPMLIHFVNLSVISAGWPHLGFIKVHILQKVCNTAEKGWRVEIESFPVLFWKLLHSHMCHQNFYDYKSYTT